ncbi:septum formation protein [Natronincola peptidivorans]|uniref:dTTP/UTP pyrophosphatase n=1 Tax=Natronincola peptidivorans TaxID=426128 RepID=A0A1H9Z0N6_9FIRM|nr:Maf family protein [Natronincola peptidivorans]SES75032.1 septum formation protein [Natronincola peptidivorans]
MSKIILASGSPRRKEILTSLGIKFDIITSNTKEKFEEDESPYKVACDLALEKAKDVSQKINENAIIIAADTLVFQDNILGKPQNNSDAFKMLKSLSGNQHEVVTGVTLFDVLSKKEITDFEVTKVFFRELDDDEIEKYIATGEPMDKAGGYGIQGKASLFIEKIDGDYFNVVGLPIYKLGSMLKKHFNISLL